MHYVPRATHAFLFLLIIFLFLSTLYNISVPLGEGPDESGHMAYVLFLAREQRLPVQRPAPANDDVPGEGHQPPLAYLLALPAVLWLPHDQMQVEQRANPHFRWNGGDQPAAFMRASREYWPWQGVTLAWHLARGMSTILGAIAVWCVWQAAQTVIGRTTLLPLLAAALVAFNPQFLFTSALVTNDALLAALSAALIWLCLLPVRSSTIHSSSSMVYRSVLAGVLFGLALLTKQSALLFGPLLVWASWRVSSGWRAWIVYVGIWGTTALVVAGWWYLRNYLLYADIFGLSLFQTRFMTQPFDWQSLQAWLAALAQLHASFWARFGWMSLFPPPWVIGVYAGIEVLALLGVALLLRFRQSISHTPQHRQVGLSGLLLSPWLGIMLVLVLTGAWIVSFALTAGLVAWQGRMLFPALPAIGILLAAGLTCAHSQNARAMPWLRSPPHPRTLAYGVMLTCLLLALYLPFGVIRPAYSWYTLPPAEAQARIETPLEARFAQSWERGVELRGWQLAGVPQPGQTITVTLTWHALEALPRDWTVFLHLVDKVDNQARIMAQDNRRPQDGRFPMPLWTPGDWVEDAHTLVIPADLPPGSYELHAGLYLPDDRGERQYTRNPAGEPVSDFVVLGIIEVTSATQGWKHLGWYALSCKAQHGIVCVHKE